MSTPNRLPRATPEALDAAKRASARTAVVVHGEMKRGIQRTLSGVDARRARCCRGGNALWCYRHFRAELETFDAEMQNASLGLINQLRRYL